MAEFEPGMHALLPPQVAEIRRIISRARIPEGEGIDPLNGSFSIIDGRDSTERVLFNVSLIGSEGNQLYTTHNGRIRIRFERVFRTGNRRIKSVVLSEERMRVVNQKYSGVYKVGQSGWVLLNIINPENGEKLSRDDLYEGRLIRASQGLDPNIESEAPCILVHPDYRGIKEVRAVAFDPLVSSINTVHRLVKVPLDAVLIDDNGKFIPKMVVRMLTRDQWSRISPQG